MADVTVKTERLGPGNYCVAISDPAMLRLTNIYYVQRLGSHWVARESLANGEHGRTVVSSPTKAGAYKRIVEHYNRG